MILKVTILNLVLIYEEMLFDAHYTDDSASYAYNLANWYMFDWELSTALHKVTHSQPARSNSLWRGADPDLGRTYDVALTNHHKFAVHL